jgi:hypothetical protein
MEKPMAYTRDESTGSSARSRSISSSVAASGRPGTDARSADSGLAV